jgi:hypothetical protein
MTALDISAVTARYDQLDEDYTAFVEKAGKELRDEIQKTLEEIVKLFFAANPHVASLSWHQYTPYFNDGDSCIFSVGDPQFTLKNSAASTSDDGDEDEDDDGDDFDDEDGERPDDSSFIRELRYANKQRKADIEARIESLGGKDAYEKIVADFNVVKEFIQSIDEDHLETLYEDHVEVVCTRDGIESIESIDHD